MLDDWFDAPFHTNGAATSVTVLDPGLSSAFPRRADIVELALHAEGEGDGPPWIAVVRVADGRWIYMSHTLQITGDVWWTMVVAATKQRLWWWALTDEDRERLAPQLSAVELDEELVQIDELLESPDPEVRAKGEVRMLQRHRR